MPELLLDGLGCFVQLQGVLIILPRETRNVSGLPCEDALVVPKEGSEHAFQFVIELSADDCCLGWVIEAEADILHLGAGAGPCLFVPSRASSCLGASASWSLLGGGLDQFVARSALLI